MVRRRPSAQALAVLRALADDPERWRYGYDLSQEVDLKAGSLYPILMRLHDRGLLESSWESDPPGGRPPRHLYRLSAEGARTVGELTFERSALTDEAGTSTAVVAQPSRTPSPVRRPAAPLVRWDGSC